MGASNETVWLDDIARRAMEAYHKAKDLNAAVELLLDGIAQGHAAAAENPAAAKQIMGTVKAMAFNLASFTFPGWDEPGITITPQQLAIGRDAAELNLRLALELNRPADKVAVAHWLVGAHALAAGEFDPALKSFAQHKTLAGDDANRNLADGYSAIANLAAGRNAAEAFDNAVANLNALDTQDGHFFAEQLVTVRRVFARK